jgi:hypothetical protein
MFSLNNPVFSLAFLAYDLCKMKILVVLESLYFYDVLRFMVLRFVPVRAFSHIRKKKQLQKNLISFVYISHKPSTHFFVYVVSPIKWYDS